jgi:hypothetical protein
MASLRRPPFPTHNAMTRQLYYLHADPDELWQEARTLVKLTQSI